MTCYVYLAVVVAAYYFSKRDERWGCHYCHPAVVVTACFFSKRDERWSRHYCRPAALTEAVQGVFGAQIPVVYQH
ncbi:hypothetical protein [Salinisphaera sp. G21_0]|uniref:hypothetical protein n=1 Tax=Salinisphaera sp. G21_0 TaxID=2821094 RepID=UPI001ADA59BC|nr:hypothetical protein [Salinisphaera sp. G21_0]MBO9481297.1 hypothetical protein [Salinisphaera sp. G21_0]